MVTLKLTAKVHVRFWVRPAIRIAEWLLNAVAKYGAKVTV